MGTHVVVGNLRKSFRTGGEEFSALAGIELDVAPGQFSVLVGDSGSGKTTLLRCLAGLEQPDAGEILLDKRTVFSSARQIFIPASERQIGMVFQSYAIWPHLTVAQNVATPLLHGRRKYTKAAAAKRVSEALEVVGLAALADRPAPRLSGGQQQRVALARALAVTSELLLMDEPMSNLDARLREEVRSQLRSIVGKLGTTVVYVTHDQQEAMSLADEIVLLRRGQILQRGTPADLYDRSTSRAVAEFFGPINVFAATPAGADEVTTTLGHLKVTSLAGMSGPILIGIRPERIRVNGGETLNTFDALVDHRIYLGPTSTYRMKIGNCVLRVDSGEDYPIAARIRLTLPVEALHVFKDGHLR